MPVRRCVYVVDDDEAVRDGLGLVLEHAGFICRAFASAEEFLANYKPGGSVDCLLLDVNLPGLDGPELQAEMNRRFMRVPIIFLSAYGTIPLTVRAIKAGAVDFLTKPVPSKELVERLNEVFRLEIEKHHHSAERQAFCKSLDSLTDREMDVLPLALTGMANKEIAKKLGISHRTVEIHRTRILQKTGTANFLELAQRCESHDVEIKPINGLGY